jgi:hypothetical protein
MLKINRAVHKLVCQLAEKTMSVLSGHSALADIPRKVVATGPLTKFFTVRTLRQKLEAAEYDARLAAAREALARAKAKCDACRGYSDDSVQCVQRDCKYLFRLAKCAGDVEDLLA